MKKFVYLLLLILFIFVFKIVEAGVTSVSVDLGSSDKKTIVPLGTINAQGGNYTFLNISGESQTFVWQGYFGDILGNITLRDNSSNRQFSWISYLYSGEVYTSRSSSVKWTTISAQNDCTAEEVLTSNFSDRVNFTFSPNTNEKIYVGHKIIDKNSTCGTWTHVNSAPQSSIFQEVILTDSTDNIFVSFIDKNEVGFDGNIHDFQMIVPTPRNLSMSTYYFYFELK